MTKKYGGQFSPDGATETAPSQPNKFSGQEVYNPNIRSKLLFLVPLPLLFSGISELRIGNSTGMAIELGAFGVLILAAWLLRDGLQAEDAYNARKVAKPPAIPRKIFASVLTGLGVWMAAYGGAGLDLISSLVYAAAASAAHSFSFGIDPLRKKGMEGFDSFETERVTKAIEKAEKLLSETVTASHRIKDRALEARIESLARTARDMFRTIEEDPRDLTRARKFIGVYLKGARDATIKFANLYTKNRDQDARLKYENLLNDLEKNFSAHRETLLLDDRSDLDIEIEVLQDRLKQEGVHAKR